MLKCALTAAAAAPCPPLARQQKAGCQAHPCRPLFLSPPPPLAPQWLQGYSERFGITHVDFATQVRTVKDSGRYLSEHFFTAN